jgi:hypothetical protein
VNKGVNTTHSEEDRKALKEAKKKRKALVDINKARQKEKKTPKNEWTVSPESVANIGGPDSMLGKPMSRFVSLSYTFLALCTKLTYNLFSLDADRLEEVCVQVAEPMKKAVRKTMEEAVFLVSNFCYYIYYCFIIKRLVSLQKEYEKLRVERTKEYLKSLQVPVAVASMVRPPPPPKILMNAGDHVNVGEWVEVEHCYSVGYVPMKA